MKCCSRIVGALAILCTFFYTFSVAAADLACGSIAYKEESGTIDGSGNDPLSAYLDCSNNASLEYKTIVRATQFGCITEDCQPKESCRKFITKISSIVAPKSAATFDADGNIIDINSGWTPQDLSASYDKAAKKISCVYYFKIMYGCTLCCPTKR